MSIPPGGPLWPEHWAVQADLESDRIEYRLGTATAHPLTAVETAATAAVRGHVAEARAACRPTGRRRRRGLRNRWRGTSVERAYVHLHAAKVFLVDVLPEAELTALLPEVSTRLAMTLDRNDPRRVEGERMVQNSTGLARRAAVKQAMETAYDASDEEYVRLRDFRNIIVLAAAAITVLTAILVALVARWPEAIPLCFDPAVTTAGPAGATAGAGVCPSGNGRQPGFGDILIVAGLGALGGALGALVGIRNLRGTSTPYSVSTALAILKIPSGAMTTIIGLLLLAGGFVPGLTNLDSQRQILSYALLFGLAQHLITRVADNRAQQLLDNLPSKDPAATPAQPPVVIPRQPAPEPTEPPADTATPIPPADEAATAAPPADEASTPPPEDPDAPGVVVASGDYLSAAEVGALTGDEYPLDPEEPDEFPDDDGVPQVTADEAAETGTGQEVG